MSLHLNQQCQRADAHPPPVRLFRASVTPTKKRRETNARPSSKAASACWRGIYVWPANASTGFFAILLQSTVGAARDTVDGLCSLQDRSESARFKQLSRSCPTLFRR